MLRCCSLGSGSEGNALIVEARDGLSVTRVLLDCGFGPRALRRKLEAVGLSFESLDAIVVTHEHADHIAGVTAVARRAKLPIYASRGTAAAGRLWPDAGVTLREIHSGVVMALGALEVVPFAVPHDAREPTQYRFSDGARRLAVVTDLGHSNRLVAVALAGAHALVLECNHDEQLLRESIYPPFLKARIGGSLGHLSNTQAAALLGLIAHPRLNWVAAAHLSRQNNRPALARAALGRALDCAADEIRLADQDLGLAWSVV